MTDINLTLRRQKQSPLTIDEVDANFVNLRNGITSSESTLSATDQSLQTQIQTETQNRINADNLLNARVTTIESSAGVSTPVSGHWWNDGYVKVTSSGTSEMGNFVDYHTSDASTNDFDVRMEIQTTTNPVGRSVDGIRFISKHSTQYSGGYFPHFRYQLGDGIVTLASGSEEDPNAANLALAGMRYRLLGMAQTYDANFDNPAIDGAAYGNLGPMLPTGGYKVSGYMKNGVNVGVPALQIEGIKDDDGQLYHELGAVNVASFRYSNGAAVQKVANDNLFTISNLYNSVFAVKGDGRVYQTGPNLDVVDDRQLVNKQYLDTRLAGVSGGGGSVDLSGYSRTDGSNAYGTWNIETTKGAGYSGIVSVHPQPATNVFTDAPAYSIPANGFRKVYNFAGDTEFSGYKIELPKISTVSANDLNSSIKIYNSSLVDGTTIWIVPAAGDKIYGGARSNAFFPNGIVGVARDGCVELFAGSFGQDGMWAVLNETNANLNTNYQSMALSFAGRINADGTILNARGTLRIQINKNATGSYIFTWYRNLFSGEPIIQVTPRSDNLNQIITPVLGSYTPSDTTSKTAVFLYKNGVLSDEAFDILISYDSRSSYVGVINGAQYG